MNKAKIFALLILTSGLVASLVILKTPGKNRPLTADSSFRGSDNPSLNFESVLQLIRGGASQDSDGESNNFTENLAALYASKIVSNAETSGVLDSDSLDVENLELDQILRTGGSALDIPAYKLSDIKISDDNSIRNQIAYLEGIDELLRENFGGFQKNLAIALDEFFTKKNPTSLKYLAEHIPGYLDGLLALPAPSLWQTVHLQILNLWQKKLVVYRAILDFDSDPLKAYLALNYVLPIAEEDINLQNVLVKRYEELISES